MLRVLLLPLVFHLVFCPGLNAQDNSFFYSGINQQSLSQNKHALSFQFQSMSFLKNNEYFNPIDEGITFLGTSFNPFLKMDIGPRFAINAGWYGILYSGKDQISVSVPYYNVMWNFAEGYSVKMGNISGYHHHRLPEPLFSHDRMYTGAPESGVQVIASRKHHLTDIWLNWENFILPGENQKEEFVIGGRSFVFLKPRGEGFNLALTLNGIAVHKGGQVGAGGNLSTLMNSATGLMVYYKPAGSKTDSIGIRNDFCGYNDASPVKLKLYSRGWGNYTTVFGKWKGFYAEGGLWYGRHFIAPRGEWLYQSVSNLYTVYWEPSNTIITFKTGWTHRVTDGVKAALGGGCYYDTALRSVDYYYHFHISVQLNWLLKEFPHQPAAE